jgi:hypothetical protein
MENIDIIILSTIVTTLFAVFAITMWRELNAVSKNPPDYSKETGPRANMIRFVGRLFDESETKKMNPRQQAMVYQNVKRTIADMESDGVYFPKEVTNKLKQKREELICNYSDLPSVMTYLEEDDFYNGHS